MRRLPLVAAILIALAAPAFAASPLDELKRSFTLDGKPIPPEIFRDMGDADLADPEPVLVTVDARAAIGSNRYADPIVSRAGWLAQSHPADKPPNGAEETGYRFIGATKSGLLVVVAYYNGGGSGAFATLHVLEAKLARAFDSNGKVYERVCLTMLRSVVLGDRWDGEATIAGDSIHIASKKTPAASVPSEIEATRP